MLWIVTLTRISNRKDYQNYKITIYLFFTYNKNLKFKKYGK